MNCYLFVYQQIKIANGILFIKKRKEKTKRNRTKTDCRSIGK